MRFDLVTGRFVDLSCDEQCMTGERGSIEDGNAFEVVSRVVRTLQRLEDRFDYLANSPENADRNNSQIQAVLSSCEIAEGMLSMLGGRLVDLTIDSFFPSVSGQNG